MTRHEDRSPPEIREQVRDALERHPDASVSELMGWLELAPEYRSLVTSVRSEEQDDEPADTDAAAMMGGGEDDDLTLASDLDEDELQAALADDEPEVFGLGVGTVDDPEDVDAWHDQYEVERCEPPTSIAAPVDVEARRQAMAGARYDEFVDADGPIIWGDPPGTGKTTTAAIAAAERERSHVVLFDKHEKAREFQQDDATPDEYYHLKGGAQPRKEHCMDAAHAGDECPEHGHAAECPRMCPIYDRPTGDDLRSAYETLLAEVGPIEAHIILDPHDGEDCAWQAQYDGLADRERIVGVHQYGLLATLQADRDVIWDEGVSLLKREREVGVEGLVLAANHLDRLADMRVTGERTARNMREFARFARELVDVITGDRDARELTYPALDPRAVAERRGVHQHYDVGERDVPEESLAQLRLRYNRSLLGRMREGEWDGTPLCLDTLFALAAVDPAGEPREDPERGIDHDAAMQAIAVPPLLEDCPWCESELAFDPDREVLACTSDDCEWDDEHFITHDDGEQARATAWWDGTVGAPVQYEQLPEPSQLPARSLFLDATPRPERIEGLFGLPAGSVPVRGETPATGDMHVTQILDGQYHASTIESSETARKRIQAAIDQAAAVHDRPLIIGQRRIKRHLDLPDNAEWLHYHAARGLNRDECDAVICVGAPHPDVWALERNADLLAMGRDVRVGGVECSNRRDESGAIASRPPVYRQLQFVDEHGDGRAVPTKHYTGLVGALFRATREDELRQAIHRIRPILAEETQHVYLLTNVPTDIPVDDVCTFEELTEPLRAILDLPEGAVDLLEYTHDAMRGDGPDGFRADALVREVDGGDVVLNKRGFHRLAQLNGEAVTYETVSNWVNALAEWGLVEPGAYEQRRGVRFRVERATFDRLLQVLTGNAGSKVAAHARLRRLLADRGFDGELLAWLREVATIGGVADPGDRPPDPT